MIKKDRHVMKDGKTKTQLRVVYSYRDSKTKKVKLKTIKNYGYLEDYQDQEKILEEAQKFSDEYMKEKRVVINKTFSKLFYEDDASIQSSFGFKYLECIFESLNLQNVFSEIPFKGKIPLYEKFKFLVLKRMLEPQSKRASYQSLNSFYSQKYSFSLYSLYRSLTYFDQYSDKIQFHINKEISKNIGRNTQEVYFDTTNFYFEKDFDDLDEYEELQNLITDSKIIKKEKIISMIDDEGKTHQYRPVKFGICKRGVSKEHVVNPIVQFGLLMDENGLPIYTQAFPGNTSDSKTLIPILEKVKNEINTKKIIVVADKGMNSSENIDILCNSGNGYVFSQILKGKKGKRYEDILFKEENYTVVNDDYKYQILEEEYEGKDNNGNKITRKRKVLIYWSGPNARRDKRKREEKLRKAGLAISNKAYTLKHGYEKYIKELNLVSKSGEIADENYLSVDLKKAEEDEKYDGYFSIVTSELSFGEKKIREIYHNLWKIEESFKVCKSDLIARPIFVWTESHIRGHLLICSVALTVLKILQHKMGNSLSIERIQDALNSCLCSEIDKGIIYSSFYAKKEAFKTLDENGDKSVPSLTIDEGNNQTCLDLKKILSFYKGDPINSTMNKSSFDIALKTIKLK